MNTAEFKKELNLLIDASYPMVLCNTFEERRAIGMLTDIAKSKDRELFVWSVTGGVQRVNTNVAKGSMPVYETVNFVRSNDSNNVPITKVESTNVPSCKDLSEMILNITLYKQASIFILKDIHNLIQTTQGINPHIIRLLRDLTYLSMTQKSVIFLSPHMEIPEDLKKSVTILDMPLPSPKELGEFLDNAVKEFLKEQEDKKKNAEYNQMMKERRNALIEAARGLTMDEFENVIAKGLSRTNLSVDIINNEKKQIILKGGLLQYVEPDEDLSSIGGLDNLKLWIDKSKLRFTKEAEEFGLEKPKGILLIGTPGTGKSLTAKVVANILQLPLLRLDISDIASKWYGETTGNIKRALMLAEAISPVVFWWDEVEKIFSRGQGGAAHEETSRSLGTLLTHFEECKLPIFRVATCNTSNLPPELMQRFERIFFLDLPNPLEREEIFAIHIQKVGRDPNKFNLPLLASESDGFAGREIRTVIKEALSSAFYAHSDLTTEFISKELKDTTPTSKQKEAELTALREWAKGNATPATSDASGISGAFAAMSGGDGKSRFSSIGKSQGKDNQE